LLAKEVTTLESIQNWLGTYTDAENIALVPELGGGGPRAMGMYWLRSWSKTKKDK
jgi:hypothetical protein